MKFASVILIVPAIAVAASGCSKKSGDHPDVGFVVGAISGPTTEGGGQAQFTIALHSKPKADVIVHLYSDDPAAGAVSSSSLTFTQANFAAPQTLTLTGAPVDHVATGDVTWHVAFGATTSQDKAYAAIAPAAVTVVEIDTDSAGIQVSPIAGGTTDRGGQTTFTVVLDSAPTSDVVVHLHTSDPTIAAVSTSNLTFTSANYGASQAVTLTGVVNPVATGNQFYTVQFGATTSADPRYSGLTPAALPVLNLDRDIPQILVSAASGPTSESGGQATFTVQLTSEPTADVTVNFHSSDVGEGTPDVTSLTFTPQDYDTPQTVTVTGVEDAIVDGNQPYAIQFGATVSNDPDYAAITPDVVPLINLDDDTAQILVSRASGWTSEAGGTATFTVALTAQPTADVTLDFDSNRPTEGTVSTTQLTFTSTNYATPQTVVVTGHHDGIVDGDQPFDVVFLPATSGDAAYSGLTPADVSLVNRDIDSIAVAFAQPRVAILANTGDELDVKAQLTSAGIASVDTYSLYSGTPSLTTLDQYDSVFVFSEAPLPDPAGLGDVLADYSDQGHSVVSAAFIHLSCCTYAGRFGTAANGYEVLASGGSEGGNQPVTLGTVYEPTSPLMSGVSNLQGPTPRESSQAVINGGIRVADWSDGAPLVVRGVGPLGQKLVELNNFPARTDPGITGPIWTGDTVRLLGNLVSYLGARFETLLNPGFEEASFDHWTAATTCSMPYRPWTIDLNLPGFGFRTARPYVGSHWASAGFDGDGPCNFTLSQTVSLPSASTLTFSWEDRTAWDLRGHGATQDRTIQASIGGTTVYTRTVPANTFGDSGYDFHRVTTDVPVSGSVTVQFTIDVPESFTGPGEYDLDDVSLSVNR